jgi:hypothetical protein
VHCIPDSMNVIYLDLEIRPESSDDYFLDRCGKDLHSIWILMILLR